MSSSTAIGLSSPSPTVSRPIPVVRGRRPSAASTSSASKEAPSSSSIVTGPAADRETLVAARPSLISTPHFSRDSRTWAPANGSSRSIRSPRLTSVTFDPSRANAWESSTPTTPPPRTASRSGTAAAVVASMFVHGRASLSPPSPAADTREPRGHRGGSRRLVVRPRTRVLEPVDVGNQSRRAGRHDHGLSGDELLVADDAPPLALEPATSTDERDAVILEP